MIKTIIITIQLLSDRTSLVKTTVKNAYGGITVKGKTENDAGGEKKKKENIDPVAGDEPVG